MDYTGIVFERRDTSIATLEVTITGQYAVCKVFYNDQMVIQFPLPASSDSNEIALRTSNVINQTGLVVNSVRVDVEPIE